MNPRDFSASSSRLFSELAFAWLTLTAAAVSFAVLATFLSAMGLSETVSFVVPLFITLVPVVALHLNRVLPRELEMGRSSIWWMRIPNLFIRPTQLPSGDEEEIAELFVRFYWTLPPERRTFEAVLEDVARELRARDDREEVKAELEKASQTIQRMLEGLGGPL